MNKELKQLNELKRYSSKMRLAAESWDAPWKCLIATILAARTKDETTIPVATKLFEKYNSIEKLSKADLKDIEKIIKPINFYKNKAKSILNCSRILVERFKGKIPLEFDKLINLPGVGRKTANVFLSEMGKDAIGVDTHCFYISRKLGWTKSKDPKKIEGDLKKLFPKEYWRKINPTLVRFGKTYTNKKEKDRILDKIKESFK